MQAFNGRCVYFIEAVGLGRVKIGFTTNIFRRFWQLQTCCPAPLEVLGIIDGGRDIEARYHRSYGNARIIGEWYRLFPRMRRFTYNLRGMPGGPQYWHDYWAAFLEARDQQTSKITIADMSYFDVPVELACEGSR